jgi:hypothetical protein
MADPTRHRLTTTELNKCDGQRPPLQIWIDLAQHRANGTLLRTAPGGVVEWFMAPVLKTGRAQALVGSNPTPSAISLGLP